MCWSKNLGLSSIDIQPKMNKNLLLNCIITHSEGNKMILKQGHENFATFLLMSGMCFSSRHYFVTRITVIDKSVREVLAFNVIDNVKTSLVLEYFALLRAQ